MDFINHTNEVKNRELLLLFMITNASKSTVSLSLYNRIYKATLLLFLVLICNFSEGLGQSEDKLGSWYIYNGFFNINPKVELFFETQLRNWETFSNPENFFLRPYFNYNVTENFQPGIGLEYHRSWTYSEDPDEKVSSNEFRMTLQTMLFHKIGRVALQHRYRYEFRNVDGDHLQRTRYRIQATVPINNKSIVKGTLFFNTFNEFLVDTKPTLTFSQNRFYLAGGYQFNKSLNFQFGYLFISRTSTTHHRLQFLLTQKLYFYDR